jgi:hypothetical protein
MDTFTKDRLERHESNRHEAVSCGGEEILMRKTTESLSWVVYRMTIHGKVSGMNAVCEQGEWETMERVQPGHHMLILAGITNEVEAERLARSSPVDGITFKPSVWISQHAKRKA